MEDKKIITLIISAITGIICFENYIAGNPLDLFGNNFPNVVWLFVPVVMGSLVYKLWTPAAETLGKEPKMAPSEEVRNDFLHSEEKAKYGPAADHVKVEDVLGFQDSKDWLFILEMAGKKFVLLADGRKGIPRKKRAYTLISWNKIHQYGFNSVYDIKRKLSGTGGEDPVTEALDRMSRGELKEFLKKTGQRQVGKARGV